MHDSWNLVPGITPLASRPVGWLGTLRTERWAFSISRHTRKRRSQKAGRTSRGAHRAQSTLDILMKIPGFSKLLTRPSETSHVPSIALTSSPTSTSHSV